MTSSYSKFALIHNSAPVSPSSTQKGSTMANTFENPDSSGGRQSTPAGTPAPQEKPTEQNKVDPKKIADLVRGITPALVPGGTRK